MCSLKEDELLSRKHEVKTTSIWALVLLSYQSTLDTTISVLAETQRLDSPEMIIMQ